MPYDEFLVYTEPFESKYDMRQILPRFIQSAAMHTPMILFSGRYSGILQPGEHFIELKKDFSNVDSGSLQVDDLDALEQMARRAHQHLVKSEKFSYRRFVELIVETIMRNASQLEFSCARAWGTATSPILLST